MNIESLIHAQLDGEITAEQHLQLESLLIEDWQARRLYLELADQHARLLHQPTVNAGRLQKSSKPRVVSQWYRFVAPLVTAAAIAFAVMLWPRKPSPVVAKKEATATGVAMLSQTLDAQFDQSPMQRGDAIVPGRISLAKGLAQIEFFSGATVLIEGDAELDIISAWEVRCIRGRVRVHVPPAAKGFLMQAPDVKLEDLGTEFAINVVDQTSAVHVFEGEVIAHTAGQAPASLTTGMSIGPVQEFLAIHELQSLIHQREERLFEQWQKWSKQARTDSRLIAYYTFKHWADDRWDRLINNFTVPPQKQRAGGAVGARWTEGRWPGKEALEFKRPGDRVRMNLDGTYNALTLACWVKVDSVDKKYNGLLLTDRYDNGEPHWQIYEDGSLMFSIMYRPQDAAKNVKYNQIYFSRPVFTTDSLGRWHHLAVSYENQSGSVIQYFDGREVSREISALHQPDRPIAFGPCEIGNWGLPTPNHEFPIRNLNGAIDEFAIYSAVLTANELRSIYDQCKPE